jgi:hypothetical protein
LVLGLTLLGLPASSRSQGFTDPAPPQAASFPADATLKEATTFPGLTFHAAPKPLPEGAVTADWPRFLGPSDDAKTPETQLLDRFPEGGLKKVWEMKTGNSYTSPAIVAGRMVVFHRLDDEEVIRNVAGRVRTLGALEDLTFLSAVDMMAVGPDNFTDWKGLLLFGLYDRVRRVLEQGIDALWRRDEELAERRVQVASVLGEEASVQEVERFFGALLATGLSFMLVVQAMTNMAVAVRLFPTTGQPLPVVSYGGTSLLFTCLSIGIILAISRSVTDPEGWERAHGVPA